MKNISVRLLSAVSVLLAGFSLNCGALPIISTNFSFVTIQATEPLASEPGNNPATFTFSRVGNTNSDLTISFRIGGTASNGVDYAAITNSISLAAGQTSTNLLVTPVSEPSATGYKTVVLTLRRHSAMEPLDAPNFFVGSVDRAVAYIAYNYTNVAPTVSLVSPTNGSTFLSLPNIQIEATASDSNGWVTSVQFFANSNSLGVVSNGSSGIPLPEPLVPGILRESHGSMVPGWFAGHVNRFQFVWTNVPAGDYALTAVATDNGGLQTTSPAINITVTTNLPTPTVRIVSPQSGAVLPDDANINIYAAAFEVGGVVDTVQFLDNGTNLGVATNYLATEPSSQFHGGMRWLPYFFRWTNASVGSNVLTAVATDNNGIMATSAPISITISSNAFRWPFPSPPMPPMPPVPFQH